MNPDQASQAVEFRPRGWLANTHVQSLMTSGPWRKYHVQRRARAYLARSQPELIRCWDGTRLLGFRARPLKARSEQAPPLVILLHGWEGSADSNYLLSSAVALDAAGFATFRLNFRDHGPTHHLNEGLFHSCRLAEVADAVAQICAAHAQGPTFLVGFSLGGNFALRIARVAPEYGFKLARAVAVSPVVRPLHVLDALENGLAVYHRYFVYKWRRSLKIKQQLFPQAYDLSDWMRVKNLRAQTEWLVEHLTPFPTLHDYLEGYSIAGDYLSGLATPSLIISAADDPIIPVSDFRELPRIPALELELLARGGHCGFIDSWRMHSWIEQKLIGDLCRHLNS
ncbi:MAG: YheT family hydrolase [Wenzhouxiangella sp.]